MGTRKGVLFALLAVCSTWPIRASAVGESVDGFPSYAERIQLELANRARVDPQVEMTACGSDCGEGACYAPQPPLYYSRELNHSARFHAAHMSRNGYFAHDSSCEIVPTIAASFPELCDGSASCACVGGTNTCPCTSWSQRIGLFGVSAAGEIIASSSDPEQAFYLWLYEPSDAVTCGFSASNGHRWLLLTSGGPVGFGADGTDYVGDFTVAGGDAHKIASGSHLPRQAADVEAWANWHDVAAPSASFVDLDGACTAMSLARGTAANGAYRAALSGVGSGCHRYYFAFLDGTNALVTYPETGSLGIGPADSCPDWSAERPTLGSGCPAPEPEPALGGAFACAALLQVARRRRRIGRGGGIRTHDAEPPKFRL